MRRLLVYLAALAAVPFARADIFNKADNTFSLNDPGSWVNNAVPSTNDIARWDHTVGAANTAATLGANLAVRGISILDPGATVTIAAGNTLTNGAAGIDMSSASVDLVLNNTVFIAPGALQQWNVAPGRTLTVAAIPTKPGQPNNNTGVLQIGNTGGTVKLGAAASAIIYDNQNNPWVTYGLYDWAALDGTGTVIPATYVAASTALTGGANNDVQASFNVNAAVDVSSLRFDSPTPVTLAVSSSGTTRTLTARGILVTPNFGGGGIGGNPASSFVRPSRVSGGSPVYNTSFNIVQNSPNDFNISANISDASSSTPVHVVKSGPGNLILSNPGNGFSGGIDVNAGTLTLAAGASSGSTNGSVAVNSGRLVITASNTTFVGRATINSGGTNTIAINSANAQQYIPTVTFNAGNTRLEVKYADGILPSSTIAPLLASNLVVNGSVTVDVYNNNLTPGVYPLIQYTNSFSGVGSLILGSLPSRVSGYLSNDTTSAMIDLVVTNVNQPISWAVGNADWDVNNSASWKDPLGNSVKYQQSVTPYSSLGDSVVFGDAATGSSPITVNLTANVSPAGIVANGTKSYTISGSGTINGLGGITKSGSGTLTLATGNNFSGALNLNGGALAFSSLANLGTGPINFNGGILRFTNGASDDISVRTLTFGAGGATIDGGPNSLMFANPIGNAGPGGFTKIGSGTLMLSGTNSYKGNTYISNGTLMLGGNTYISNSPAIIVNATLDTASYGVNLELSPSVNQVLCGTGTISGTVTALAGTTISPATNGVAGTLNLANDLVVSGGTLAFDVSNTGHDQLNVAGNITINSGSVLVITNTTPLNNGVYKLIQYSGGLLNGSGSSANLIIQGLNLPGKIAALSDATPNEIDLVISTQGGATTTWIGNDPSLPGIWDIETSKNFANASHTAVTFVQGDKPTFDDTSVVPTVNLMTAVQPGSVTVNSVNNNYTFQDGTFTGAGKLSGTGGLTKNGSSTLTILTLNNNSGATVINGGTVQVGNGSQSGDLGTGNVNNNGTLIFQQIDNRTVAGQVSGSGSLTQQGSATLTLAQDNSYSGATTISSGALQIGNGAAAGTLGTAAVTDNGNLIFNRSGTLSVPNSISGSGALSTLGSSTLTFTGPLAYQGNTFISNGVVRLSAANQIPNGTNVAGSTGWLILDGSASRAGTLDLNGFDQAVNALSGLGGTFTGVITNSGASTTTTNTFTVFGQAGTTFNGVIADNAAGAKTKLVLRGATELRLNGNNTYSGGTFVGDSATIGIGINSSLGSGTLTVSNGTTFSMHNQGGTSAFLTANVFIPDNATVTNFSTSLGNGYAGVITGSATTTNIISASSGQGVSYSPAGLKQLQPFLGTLVIPLNQTLRFSGSSVANGGDFTTFDVEGYMSSKNGGTIAVGSLLGSGTIGSPTAGTVTWIVGGKNTDSTFSGTIADTAPAHNALMKVGTGKLTLTGPVNYSGPTTVSNGILAIASDSVTLDNSPSITLSGDNATIDMTGHYDPTLYLGNLTPQALNGHGIINGQLFEQATTTNNLTPGVLHVTQTATINGGLTMQINRTNAVNSAQLSAPTFVNGGSIILNVLNVGSTNFAGGDKFQLFNQAFTGDFVSVTLPTLPSPQMYWTNNIAVDGSISVVSTVTTNPNPTNITTSVSGNVLTLSWPGDHQGWTLQQSTNIAAPIWQDVPGSANGTNYSVTIDPNVPSIFYRMRL